MGALANQRWEVFAQEIAKGVSPPKAYAKSGHKGGRTNAYRLAKQPDVARRVKELQDAAAGRVGLSLRATMEEVRRIAFANIGDYLEFDDKGQPSVQLHGKTRDQMAAVGEVSIKTHAIETKDGPVIEVKDVRFKLHPKLDALDKLIKHLGGYLEGASLEEGTEDDKVAQPLNLDALNEDELRMLLALRRKILQPAVVIDN